VALVGDFNDWDRSEVHLERQGTVWTVTLRLPPGRYRYSFLADGNRWISDGRTLPSDDDFNTPTQVVTVAN
jgi:1,4-alpha-glucan branching enzyme